MAGGSVASGRAEARILVIEDDASLRGTLRLALRRERHDVIEAEEGLSGMRLFRERRPDLVITDIVMPEQEGLETIMQLRALAPGCPIIAISGAGRIGNADFLQMALRLGASAALAKPFGCDRLSALVAQCLADAGRAPN